MPNCWSLLFSPPGGLPADERNKLANFLARNIDDATEHTVLVPQLRRLHET